MKKYIYTVCACLSLFATHALAGNKTYTMTTHTVTLTKVDSNAGEEIQIPLTNTTNTNDTIKWVMINNTFTFTGWNYWFCDLNQCYTGKYPSKNTDIVGTGSAGTASFSITINSFNKLPADAIMQIVLYDIHNPTQGDTVTFQVYAERLGVANLVMPSGSIHVFPNPATNYLNISSQVAGFVPVKASVTDITGKTVAQYSLSPADNNRVSLTGLPSGLYFVRFQDQAERVATENFIKE